MRISALSYKINNLDELLHAIKYRHKANLKYSLAFVVYELITRVFESDDPKRVGYLFQILVMLLPLKS